METLLWIVIAISVAILLLIIIGVILYFRRKEPTLEDKINALKNMPVDDLYEDGYHRLSSTERDEYQNMTLSPEEQEAKLALEDGT